MRRIDIEEAINILEQYDYRRPDILKMKVDKFIDIINKHIGIVESIEFKSLKLPKKEYLKKEKK